MHFLHWTLSFSFRGLWGYRSVLVALCFKFNPGKTWARDDSQLWQIPLEWERQLDKKIIATRCELLIPFIIPTRRPIQLKSCRRNALVGKFPRTFDLSFCFSGSLSHTTTGRPEFPFQNVEQVFSSLSNQTQTIFSGPLIRRKTGNSFRKDD